jgi:hypothetical protein
MPSSAKSEFRWASSDSAYAAADLHSFCVDRIVRAMLPHGGVPMRKAFIIASAALTSLLFAGNALAQEPAPPPAPANPPAAGGGGDGDDKKMGIGGDLQFVLPLGDFGDASGPLIGPIFRFGYRVIPPLELVFKAGFLFGLTKERSIGPIKADTGVNVIPLSIGARYFFMEPQAGVYGGADIVLNLIQPKASVNGTSVDNLDSSTRLGTNLNVGYVISKELPIDIRAQFMIFNLLLTEDKPGVEETTQFGIGISGGYTYQF